MNNLKKAAVLFGQFFQFGCFTFGGGWSIVAQMQKLYVEKEKTITSQELLDITSVGRSLPGTMIGNVAMLYGYRAAGILGGIACVIAMVTPPMIVLSLITYFYTLFKENLWVMSAMTGVRAAIVPIIASAGRQYGKGSLPLSPLLRPHSCRLCAVSVFQCQLRAAGSHGRHRRNLNL